MPRRRRRAVRSVARAVGRASQGRVHADPWLPDTLTKEDRKIYLRIYRRDVARIEKSLKRKLRLGETEVVRRRLIQRIRVERASAARAFSQATKRAGPPPVIKPRRPRDLTIGKSSSAGAGSTGLGGTLKRRTHRAGPRKNRLVKPHWVDPFPWIPGTVPEKMIFEALVRRRIYFIFQAEWRDVAQDSDLPVLWEPLFKPDFIIPEYKVSLDPYSEFHHALAGAVQRDIQKRVLYDALGWEYITPWSHEVIQHGGSWVIDSSMHLRKPPTGRLSEKDEQAKRTLGYRLGPNLGAGATSVGLANRLRKRAPSIGIRRGRR